MRYGANTWHAPKDELKDFNRNVSWTDRTTYAALKVLTTSLALSIVITPWTATQGTGAQPAVLLT